MPWTGQPSPSDGPVSHAGYYRYSRRGDSNQASGTISAEPAGVLTIVHRRWASSGASSEQSESWLAPQTKPRRASGGLRSCVQVGGEECGGAPCRLVDPRVERLREFCSGVR